MCGATPVLIPTMGRAVPIAPLIRELRVLAVGVPIVNFDNNQHGAKRKGRFPLLQYSKRINFADAARTASSVTGGGWQQTVFTRAEGGQ